MSSTAASALPASVLPTPASPSSSSGCGRLQRQEDRRREPLVDEVVDGRQPPRQRLDVGDEVADLSLRGRHPMPFLERQLAALAAEVDRLSPCAQRRRVVGDDDRHAADRVDRGDRARRAAGGAQRAPVRGRRTSTIRARIESAISAAVRAPMSIPAGVSTAQQLLGDAGLAQLRRAPRCRACGWRPARRTGRRPRARRAGSPSSSRPCAATTSARSPRSAARPRRPAATSSPSSGRAARSAATIGESPATITRGAAGRARGTPRSRRPTGTGSGP